MPTPPEIPLLLLLSFFLVLISNANMLLTRSSFAQFPRRSAKTSPRSCPLSPNSLSADLQSDPSHGPRVSKGVDPPTLLSSHAAWISSLPVSCSLLDVSAPETSNVLTSYICQLNQHLNSSVLLVCLQVLLSCRKPPDNCRKNV